MALFVLSLCPFDISVGVGAFVIGLGQISSFLSLIVFLFCLLFSFNFVGGCSLRYMVVDFLKIKMIFSLNPCRLGVHISTSYCSL